MKLKQWVMFIDMLGYSQLNGKVVNEEKADALISFMNRLQEHLEISLDNNILRNGYKGQAFNFFEFYSVEYACISDSMVITFVPKEVNEPYDEKKYMYHSANALFLLCMRSMKLIVECFKEKGIFLRGGLCEGFCKIDGSFAVGEGLVKAYKNESQIAVYPRIAVDKNIYSNKRLMAVLNDLCNKMYYQLELVKKDYDEAYYLDWLGLLLAQGDPRSPSLNSLNIEEQIKASRFSRCIYKVHRKSLIGALDRVTNNSNAKVMDKYNWLVKYHNSKGIACYSSYLNVLIYQKANHYTLLNMFKV
ncbi:hypothetical protein H2O77_02455 [Cobetia sp. 4B]|uniref:hypothetical protein n=1 Tax=Cobetia sp. 4B TaxID=2758724 RepID=UPI001C05C995|nr:hypothetical protein [Cobetia sp. 4B]MBR9754746.1 hypothetical protein [Gammaproteobacteria bacterium]QWN37390.1 hypothetical protein H2O77_02455 [Cobetia sp. 4B]